MARRFSAPLLIMVPWLTLALIASVVLTATKAGWGVAGGFLLATLLVAVFTVSRLAAALKSLRADTLQSLRTRAAPLARREDIEEVHALRQAIITLTKDLIDRIEAAQAAQERAAALLASATDGIVQIDAAQRIVHVNPAARQLLNLPHDAVGRSAAALIRHVELRELVQHAAGGRAVPPIEITLDERHVLVSVKPLASGAVIALVDLTEVRRLESVRRDFVANVSHELKTPLTSIRGYTETLLSDDLPPDMQRQFLDVIRKNTERIQRIIDDLLDLSRLQSGGWLPEVQEVNVGALAADVWASCEPLASRKRIGFSVSGNTDTKVYADPDGLRQVLSNLYDNAIRYTPDGGQIAVSIKPLSASQLDGDQPAETKNWIELEVSDTGSGIPRDALPRIFERFYRVDPARSRADGGTGLGLSIVKHLIESMAGEVSAESELGKGTIVRLRLPGAP